MAVYNKYHKEVYQVSYNGGASWEDVSPAQYRKGTLMQLNSPDCTPTPPVPGQAFTIVPTEKDLSVLVWGDCYRTCDSIYIYYSYDQGQNWTKVLTDGGWFNVNVGQKISFKVENYHGGGSSGIAVRNQDNSDNVVGKFYVEGDLGTMKHVGYSNGFKKGQGFFSGMTSLTSAENLVIPDSYCGKYMFSGCTSLTTAPQLPATTLTDSHYAYMFAGCTSLTTAPELLAPTLTDNCYAYMFSGCTNLNYVKCLATDISANYCTKNWLYGVSSTGTFIKDCNNHDWWAGYDGIPNNWSSNCGGGKTPQYLTLVALENGSFSFSGTSSSTVDNSSIQYSLNSGSTWNTLTRGNSVSVTSGQKVMWKSTTLEPIPSAPNVDMGIGRFVSTGSFNVEGNVMSLYYGDNFSTDKTIYQQYAFENLFKGCSGLTSAENLILPATTLGYCCYRNMFQNCTSLTTAPELPATNLSGGNSCYNLMFYNCTSLRAAPQLPATTLSRGCYANMFYNCTSITTAPSLPATTLADSCYSHMFWKCSSITTLPNNYLPATTLESSCYHNMFRECTSLTNVPTLPATTLATWCYYGMFADCKSLTSVPSNYLPVTTLKDYCYTEMFDGCTGLTTAPDLPATTLVKYCYGYMFYKCSNLNYVKCLATNISAENCTTNWLQNVASSGTFYKNSSMSSWPRTVNGIPSGWSVYNA